MSLTRATFPTGAPTFDPRHSRKILAQRISLREQIDALLAEGISGAIERERTEFDKLTGRFKDSLVLFGARKLGRKTLAGLRAAGIEPLAFTDNNTGLWGVSIDGLPVLSPQDAARRFGPEAAFVITVWGYGSSDSMRQRVRRLQELGCKTVVTFVPLFWKYASFLLPHNALTLPHYVHEQSAHIAHCFEVLSDEQSRREFVAQITWRVTGDFDALSDPVGDEIYFPHEVAPLKSPEVFVDCGAYDGDTILRFVARKEGSFQKIFAFEPDPSNLAALENTVSGLSVGDRQRIRILPYAVGAQNGTVRFAATGTDGAAVGCGELKIGCVRLDDALESEAPTYVKMDIEAAEPDALRGAWNLIRRHSPVIAACSYHVQDHLWTIPLLINEIDPRYRILLRQHIQLVEDLVCYAVPPERFVA